MILAPSDGNWCDAACCISRGEPRGRALHGTLRKCQLLCGGYPKNSLPSLRIPGIHTTFTTSICIHGPLALRMHRTELETTKL